MSHKFDAKKMARLDSPERKKMLPPDEIIREAGIQEGLIVADIGSGTGYFTIPIARVIGNNGRVYGLDISDDMLNEAEKRSNKADLFNIEFRKSKENQFPLLDNSVDMVFLANVLHEASDKDEFMAEIYRVLKPGGSLIVVDWQKESEIGPPIDHRISVEEVKTIMIRYNLSYVRDIAVGIGHYLIEGQKAKSNN